MLPPRIRPQTAAGGKARESRETDRPIARSTLVRMAGTEKSAANNGREIDHEADGKDDKSGSSSFIDPGINHFANDMIPVLYDWQIESRHTCSCRADHRSSALRLPSRGLSSRLNSCKQREQGDDPEANFCLSALLKGDVPYVPPTSRDRTHNTSPTGALQRYSSTVCPFICRFHSPTFSIPDISRALPRIVHRRILPRRTSSYLPLSTISSGRFLSGLFICSNTPSTSFLRSLD
jgi:hypothetical protein